MPCAQSATHRAGRGLATTFPSANLVKRLVVLWRRALVSSGCFQEREAVLFQQRAWDCQVLRLGAEGPSSSCTSAEYIGGGVLLSSPG